MISSEAEINVYLWVSIINKKIILLTRKAEYHGLYQWVSIKDRRRKGGLAKIIE